ncbi:uncharacterized protein LOC144104518 isoform X2 [Amblyomma americanum]
MCVNPCFQPSFVCHPSSDRDDRGCFEAGCPCFPENCPKRCPHHQECVLESEVDARGCFKPNCECASISATSPKNCTTSCPPGEKCHSYAAVDAQGCPLHGCVCVPDCLSPCPAGKRCKPKSPLDAKGCFKPGCTCEPDCAPRCPDGSDCDPHSPRDLHGCYLAGCICERLKSFRPDNVTKKPLCLSPCPLGKRCVENSTKDERGCFLRGCTCELDCPPRCPAGQRCKKGSPKDFEGCFISGCACESIPEVSWTPTETSSRKIATSTTSEDDSGILVVGDTYVVPDARSLYLNQAQDKWRWNASIGDIKRPSENAYSEGYRHNTGTKPSTKPSESGGRSHAGNESRETGNRITSALAHAQDNSTRDDDTKKRDPATSHKTLSKESVEAISHSEPSVGRNDGTSSTGTPVALDDEAGEDDEYSLLRELLPEDDPVRKRVVNVTRRAEVLDGSHHNQSSAVRTIDSHASPSVHQRKSISQTHSRSLTVGMSHFT